MAGSSEVDDLAVELAWSLWRALGVPGPLERHADCVVIPEPLIAFTGALGDRDRRLRDNAVAWCAAHPPLVSVRALRHTLTEERWGVGAIADLAATLHGLTGARWPDWETGKSFVAAEQAARSTSWRSPPSSPCAHVRSSGSARAPRSCGCC